jgi:hypothetical protein
VGLRRRVGKPTPRPATCSPTPRRCAIASRPPRSTGSVGIQTSQKKRRAPAQRPLSAFPERGGANLALGPERPLTGLLGRKPRRLPCRPALIGGGAGGLPICPASVTTDHTLRRHPHRAPQVRLDLPVDKRRASHLLSQAASK